MAKKYLTIADLRGGRNGVDAPLSLPETQCVEALNVDYYNSTLGHKRQGASNIGMTMSGSPPDAFTGYIVSLLRLDGTPAKEVLYCVDSAATPEWGYLTRSSTSWPQVSVTDEIASSPYHVEGASLNNRIYLCYDSTVNRLHVAEELTTLRRVGLAAPAAAPTSADSGSGAYAATVRYYKVAFTVQATGVTIRRSELSAMDTHTPSGSGTGVTVTKPATGGDGETHWELYASADNDLWWLIATTAVATTTFVDSTAPASYSGVTGAVAPPVVGTNTPPTSWKHIASNGNRLLGAGSWETNGKTSRVWYTAVLGSSDVGDLERVPTSNYVDLDEQDGDEVTGLVGNHLGNVIVFKRNQIWKLIPTGDAVTPYSRVCLTKFVGCIEAKTIVQAEDENGNPAIYFLSRKGPYRISTSGLEYCGRDIEDIWTTVNLEATSIVGHGLYYRQKHQVWYWLSTSSANSPNVRVVLDTHLCRRSDGGVRMGWSKHTGPSCTAACSVFSKASYSATIADERPYVGSNATVAKMMMCDVGTTDDSTAYQAYIKTKPYPLGGLGRNCGVGQPHLTAEAGDGVEITQTLVRDYGAESRTSTCLLTSDGDETRVQRQFDGSDLNGAGVVQIQLGDGAASAQAWNLDALIVPYSEREER